MQSSENHSANNPYISTSNRYQIISNNDDVENEGNNGDYVKPTKAAELDETNLGKKIIRRKKKITESNNPP